MFWKSSGFPRTSPIDLILEKASYTLEELLNEDELIQECRSLNGRLINFLMKKENVIAMLQYMLKPIPVDEEEAEIAKRLAWQSCEVFCCEVDPIFSVLLENEDTMALFMSILESKEPLNDTTVGYLGRAMSHLILKKPVQLTQYLMDHEASLTQFIAHLENTSITDVVIRLMGADEQSNTQLPESYLQWVLETDALEKVMNRLAACELARVQGNAAQVLLAMVRSQPSTLSRGFAEEKKLDRLLEFLISPEGEVSVPVLNLITVALDPRKRVFNGIPGAQTGALYEEILESSVFQPLFEKLLVMLPVLTEKLSQCDPTATQETPYGILKPPLGPARLKIVETLAILLRTKTEPVMQAVIDAGSLEACMELFVTYPFHNLLHQHVISLFKSALSSGYIPLLEAMFEKMKLCEWLIEMPHWIRSSTATHYIPQSAVQEKGCSTEEEADEKPQGKLRAGYLGHVTQLANEICQSAESSDVVASYLNSNADWQTFMSSVVLPINQKEDLESWACGRPSVNGFPDSIQDQTIIGQGATTSNGILYASNLGNHPTVCPSAEGGALEDEDEEEDSAEGAGLKWRAMDVLTADKNTVSGTAAMFSRIELRKGTSRIVKEMSDSSSSSSSSSNASSSSSSSGSSSGDEDEEEDSLIMVSPQSLLQNLTRDLTSGSMREEASTSEAVEEEPSPPDPFNSFNFWKIEFSDVDLPSE